MLTRFSGALKRLVGKIQKAEHVGTDRSGNKYFKRPEELDGAVVERRWIEFKGDELPDPNSVPVEWTSWLAGTRPHAPSEEEMSALEMRRTMIKFRASVLDKEEAKRKFRARSLRQAGVMEQEGPHDMSRVMDQISASSSRDDDWDSPSAKTVPDLSKRRPGSRVGVQTFNPTADRATPRGSFQPDSWQPGGSNQKADDAHEPNPRKAGHSGSTTVEKRGGVEGAQKSAEPAGKGGAFQPGAWQPD